MKKILMVTVLVIFFGIGCSVVSYQEKMRLSSPDGKVDAVLVESNAGATTAYGYIIYIVPKDTKFKTGHEVLMADNFKLDSIQWKKARQLEIKYKKGRIFKYSNFWQSRDVDKFKYIVEVRLICTLENALPEDVQRDAVKMSK